MRFVAVEAASAPAIENCQTILQSKSADIIMAIQRGCQVRALSNSPPASQLRTPWPHGRRIASADGARIPGLAGFTDTAMAAKGQGICSSPAALSLVIVAGWVDPITPAVARQTAQLAAGIGSLRLRAQDGSQRVATRVSPPIPVGMPAVPIVGSIGPIKPIGPIEPIAIIGADDHGG
jgi:hypothetical protein